MSQHAIQRTGISSDHVIGESFKEFSRTMIIAVEFDPRRLDSIPIQKGVLNDDGTANNPKTIYSCYPYYSCMLAKQIIDSKTRTYTNLYVHFTLVSWNYQ